jgi:hypothetical protein
MRKLLHASMAALMLAISPIGFSADAQRLAKRMSTGPKTFGNSSSPGQPSACVVNLLATQPCVKGTSLH